ncbi:uncharacterized protein LOC116617372 [Nematostella vectensis]|uniref:uncharacterized protein LOC116617372 n=1 Tax=Nematostella vectensis TaxID=45351 RepID=UPI00207723AD|nr:uncharacterized protein LOC116617372 [Nematostella vectensis]
MKSVLVCLLLASCVALLRAAPTAPNFLGECGDKLKECLVSTDEEGRAKCVIDFQKCVFSHDPSHKPFMKKCKIISQVCVEKAGKDMKKRIACKVAFLKCVKEHRPAIDN